MPLRGLSIVVLAVTAAVAMLWASTDYRRFSLHEPGEDDRPLEVLDGGYVGSQACRACHPHEYSTWYSSYHRTMTQKATPEAVLGAFDGTELEADGLVYRMTRSGDEYWVETRRKSDTSGVEAPATRRQVVMTTGSHHEQIYWMDSGIGRAMQMLPFSWLIQEQRWTPFSALFIRPPGGTAELPEPSAGEWSMNCNRCHSTFARPRVESGVGVRVDTRVVEFGIACEECHGPGAEHVQANMDPWKRYRHHLSGKPDPTIVQPEHLSHRRSAEVCGQCHAVTLRGEREMAHWNDSGLSFEPGDHLADTEILVSRDDDSRVVRNLLEKHPWFLDALFWPDGVVRSAGREFNGLLETPCFERGEMSCLSCHVLHQRPEDQRPVSEWTNDQLKPGMYGNSACTQCHGKYQDESKLVVHTHHAPESSGSNCYNCHMPHSTYALLKAVRSHHLDSPTVRTDLDVGRPNACNLCHLDKSLAWTARYLNDWYDTPEPELSDDERSISAAVRLLMSGDAGQRVLVAWSMGWEPARATSGTEWMAPYLGQLLEDPYDAVRYVASRSLGSLPGIGVLDYDYMGPPASRARWAQRVREAWRHVSVPTEARRAAILIDANGDLMHDVFLRLLGERDDREVILAE